MILKEGNFYAINRGSRRGHFLILFKELGGEVIFYDTIAQDVVTISKREVKQAQNTKVDHPKHDYLILLDFIETLPDDVWNEIKPIISNCIDKRGITTNFSLFERT